MATDPLSALRTAIDDACTAVSVTNQNLNSSMQAVLAQLQQVNLTPPPPVLRIASQDTLQQCLDGQGIVYVPQGSYAVLPQLPLLVRDRTILVLHPNTELTIVANDQPRYRILLVNQASDVQILGGRLVGDRLAHTYTPGSTHEWGYGVQILGGQRIYIRDLFVTRCTGDGLGITGNDITLENVVSLANRRQGASFFSGSRYRVLGGEYSNTGNLTTPTTTSAGTSPMAGIDFEPDNGDIDDVLVNGATFRGNGTDGVLLWSRTDAAASLTNFLLTNNVFGGMANGEPNANGVHASSPSGKPVELTLLRNRFMRHKGAGVFLENGASAVVGSNSPSDANVFVGMGTRTPSEGMGLMTRYDIQTRTKATANILYNRYE